jgi:hypothetical protein
MCSSRVVVVSRSIVRVSSTPVVVLLLAITALFFSAARFSGAALRLDPRVRRVEIFAPFAYDGFDTVKTTTEGVQKGWDLLVIEGYSGPVVELIRLARRLNEDVLVLHWCLCVSSSSVVALVFMSGESISARSLAIFNICC